VQKSPITVCSFAKEPYHNLLFCKRAQLIIGSFAKEPALAANTHVLQRLFQVTRAKEPYYSLALLQKSPVPVLILSKRALLQSCSCAKEPYQNRAKEPYQNRAKASEPYQNRAKDPYQNKALAADTRAPKSLSTESKER